MTSVTEKIRTVLSDRYEIERELGEGGMATVYLAHDVKHDRKVAIKVLKPDLAAVLGAERFIQEIKTTANLQHPHILPLFDSGEANGFLFYVMPYVEGETLRDKLDRDTQLGIDEAVRITTEIADALDYAHRHDVIHRDIKPENILLHDGRPMVSDFGIALAVSAAAGGRMTETGMSLGTPHYMSPEQATAEKDLTNRSDIYSLGAVLYEMLAGEPPHLGKSAQQIIMKIVTDDARPVTELRKSVPTHIAAATAKSLERLAADRFESAAKFAEALHDPHYTATAGATPVETTGAPRRSNAREMMGWGVAAMLALLLGWTVLRPAPPNTAPIPMRFTLDMIEFDGLRLGDIAVSPDGSLFALPDFEGIHLRRADDPTFRLIPAIRAISPAFSPDSKWLAYTRDGVLYKVPVEGGTPQTLIRSGTLNASDPDWGYAGTIVFTSQRTLYRVPDTGGEPEVIVEGVYGVRPKQLPDGRGILFSVPAGIMLFEFGADSARLVVPGGNDALYVETGHLVYALPEDGGLHAVPFNLRSYEVTGSSVPVRDDVTGTGSNAFYSVSKTGTLVYPIDPLGGDRDRQLLLLDLSGNADTIPLSPRTFSWPRFSPNGRLLAFNTGAGRTEQRAIYTYDLGSGSTTQITFEGGTHAAVWSPDGTRLVFSSEREGTVAEDLFTMPIDGSSAPTRMFSLPSDEHAMAWPTDSQIVFFAAPEGNQDLLIADPTNPDRPPKPYLTAEWNEGQLSISPNGDFAAYESDESGREEIYVRRFPEPLDQRRISQDGGREPRWAPDGANVYYWSLNGDTLFAAPFRPGQVTSRRAAAVVAVIPQRAGSWDVDRTSRRAVVTQAVAEAEETTSEIVVIVNWFEELRAKMGG